MAGKKADYRALSAELDEIIADLEGSELSIDAALKHYERGAVIVKQLESYLAEAETKVTNIKAKWEATLPKE